MKNFSLKCRRERAHSVDVVLVKESLCARIGGKHQRAANSAVREPYGVPKLMGRTGIATDHVSASSKCASPAMLPPLGGG